MGNPITGENEFCALAFSSVTRSVIFFWTTLVAGDAWGTCILPLIAKMPLSFVLFAAALVSVQLGFMNLVLAVIVDRAAEARELDALEAREKKKIADEASMEIWRRLMQAMDLDSNGTVSLEELLTGAEEEEMKEKLEDMNLEADDLEDLFYFMDCEEDGALDYHEFVNAFHKAQSQDVMIYLMHSRLQMSKMAITTSRKLERIESILLTGKPPGEPASHPAPAKSTHREMRKPQTHSPSTVPSDEATTNAVQQNAVPDAQVEDVEVKIQREADLTSAQADEAPSAAARQDAKLLDEEFREFRASLETRLEGFLSEVADSADRLTRQQGQLLQSLHAAKQATLEASTAAPPEAQRLNARLDPLVVPANASKLGERSAHNSQGAIGWAFDEGLPVVPCTFDATF